MRLPDLPNAGYATRREKALSDAIMFSVRAWERDRPTLLMMVIEGQPTFHARCKTAWAAWRVDDDLIREVWEYVKLLAGADPQGQLAQLMKIRPLGSKLTEAQAVAMQANLDKAAHGKP